MASNIHAVPYDNKWAAKMESNSFVSTICPKYEQSHYTEVPNVKTVRSEVLIHRTDMANVN